ncbi:hypothetical protein BDF21DRAFT_426864 [Thamnidium elegans]|nr:hypothetical protein BDF21DRAFT_426864 [Thamnidium elegans]
MHNYKHTHTQELFCIHTHVNKVILSEKKNKINYCYLLNHFFSVSPPPLVYFSFSPLHF